MQVLFSSESVQRFHVLHYGLTDLDYYFHVMADNFKLFEVETGALKRRRDNPPS
jgi:hypothetical protein